MEFPNRSGGSVALNAVQKGKFQGMIAKNGETRDKILTEHGT
jgi:hypothetical protein